MGRFSIPVDCYSVCHVEMAVDARQKHTCKLTKNTILRTEVCGVINRYMICWGGGWLAISYCWYVCLNFFEQQNLLLVKKINNKKHAHGIHVDILSVTYKCKINLCSKLYPSWYWRYESLHLSPLQRILKTFHCKELLSYFFKIKSRKIFN